jgi:hypothetical protein
MIFNVIMYYIFVIYFQAFGDFPDLVSGLVSTLSYNHLVSAGSGVYKSCLKEMDADDWTTVFMPLIVEVLTGSEAVRYAMLCR